RLDALLRGRERHLELVDVLVDAGDEAVGGADVRAELIDIRAEIRAVALEDARGLVEDLLELLDLVLERDLLGGEALVDRVDVLAHGLAFGLRRRPEATGHERSEQCELPHRYLHWNSTRRSFSSPRPVGSVSPL